MDAEDQKDMDCLLELLWKSQSDRETLKIVEVMRELNAREPIVLLGVEVDEEGQAGLQKWMNYIAERVRSFRRAANLSQKELAVRSKLPLDVIKRIEYAELSANHIVLTKLSNGLNIEYRDLDPTAD
jgi:hypothetical protein